MDHLKTYADGGFHVISSERKREREIPAESLRVALTVGISPRKLVEMILTA